MKDNGKLKIRDGIKRRDKGEGLFVGCGGRGEEPNKREGNGGDEERERGGKSGRGRDTRL